MNSNYLGRAISLLALMPMALTLQVAEGSDMVPLKHWSSPLYWQPTEAKKQAATARTNIPIVENVISNASSPDSPLVFVGITPCRVIDTRSDQPFAGAFGSPRLSRSASRTFAIQSSTTCTIPSTAQAYSFNVTVVPSGPIGLITVYPTGQVLPLAATVNSPQGLIVGNAAIVAAGTGGSVDVHANDPTDLVIDINGYYVSQSVLTALTLPQGTSNAEVKVAGGIHFSGPISSGNSITVDGTTNSITVDSNPVTSVSKISELYIGGDNRGLLPALNFDQIKVGIGTRNILQKLTIFDPTNPGLGIYGNVSGSLAGGELAVATFAGSYSNVATAGDLVLRTPGGTSKDLILTTRNSNGGGIRFTAGTATSGTAGSEWERMRILQNGFVGIGIEPPNGFFNPGYVPPNPLFGIGLPIGLNTFPFQLSPDGDLTRIKKLPYLWPASLGPLNSVLTLTNNVTGQLNWIPGGGGVAGSCISGANFVTKWSTTSAITCSQIFDNGSNVVIGNNIFKTPLAKTEIYQSFSAANTGANLLRLTAQGTGGSPTLFTEAGIVFNTSVNNANQDNGRIYGKTDGMSSGDQRRS